MILHNLNIMNEGIKNISIDGEFITAIREVNERAAGAKQTLLYFENCLAFPGIINSHDHLDFNLFPQLGNHQYQNYMEWGTDIHRQNKAVIQSVLKIPVALRTRWGMYKNLLNGVTTVVQHGRRLEVPGAPVNIFNGCHSLHSVRLEKWWQFKLNKPFAAPYPFVIHIGEGTDYGSFEEINHLLRWNLLNRKLIGIHGVAMNQEQAANFEALIWCPDSNYFLLGATAAIDKIKTATKILFGTDSTVSADWDIWQQLSRARATGLLTDDELIAALSTTAAQVWQLDKTGRIKENYYADLVVTERKNAHYSTDTDAFFASGPEHILLIMNRGRIVYFDESLLAQLNHIDLADYSRIYINKRCKYVAGELPRLIKEIKKYAPGINLPITIE
jgi:cytosine/adenosine deaminase-related metal-dependent hydrolase